MNAVPKPEPMQFVLRGHAIWLGLPALVTLSLYASLLPPLVREWAAFSHLSHGFAIPFIAAYLVWCRRNHLRGINPEPSLWGLPVLVLGLAALIVGVHGQEPFVARISLPVTLLGLVLFLAGMRAASSLWVGIAYLAFMVPLPWTTLRLLTDRSQLFDATMSAFGIRWLGVPVYQEGVLLHLSNVTLEVADGCSSIQFITALLALGVGYASVVPRTIVIRAILVVMTVPLAIAANIIRIVATAAGVHYLGTWTLKSPHHVFAGSMNFLLALSLLLVVDAALTRLQRGRT